MPIDQLGDDAPRIPASAFIAPDATLIGKIELADRVSIWFGAVLRGDNEPIRIGEDSNVQEGVEVHTDPGSPIRIGRNVTVGHQALLHGCTVHHGSLVGMQAVVLNGAVIGRNCLVGAGALVTEGKQFPDRSLILGSPAKVIRSLSDDDVAKLEDSAWMYTRRRECSRRTSSALLEPLSAHTTASGAGAARLSGKEVEFAQFGIRGRISMRASAASSA